MSETTITPAALNTRQAGDYIGQSAGHLANERSAGRGPAYVKLGGSVRYLVRDLDAWLESHRVSTLDAA